MKPMIKKLILAIVAILMASTSFSQSLSFVKTDYDGTYETPVSDRLVMDYTFAGESLNILQVYFFIKNNSPLSGTVSVLSVETINDFARAHTPSLGLCYNSSCYTGYFPEFEIEANGEYRGGMAGYPPQPITTGSGMDLQLIYTGTIEEGTGKYKIQFQFEHDDVPSVLYIDINFELPNISLNKQELIMGIGDTETLSATVIPEKPDKYYHINWLSSNPDVASVDDEGNVTANSKGKTEIAAFVSPDKKALCEVTVIPKATSIKINKTLTTLERGTTIGLKVIITPSDARNDVTWQSDDPSIAIVDDQGIVTGISVGTTLIKATTNDGTNLMAFCIVNVTPKQVKSIIIDKDEMTLERGESAQLSVTVYPQDADDSSVEWSSENNEVATVDSKGTVVAISSGTTIIRATTNDGSNLTAECQVTVTSLKATGISIDRTEATLERDATLQLTATVMPEDAGDKSVTWSSGNSKVATVDGSGLVTAVAAGTAIIRATTNDGSNLTAECQVTVTPLKATGISIDRTEATLERDATLQLTATVTPDDADDRTVTWSSADSGIARVDGAGLVIAVSVGTTTITATTGDGTGLTASCTVTVTPKTVQSITMDEEALNLERGETTRLTVIVTPQDADDVSVTWYSNNSGVATVDDGGRVTAIEVGTAVITAMTNDGSGLSAKCTVTVTPKEVDDISINKEILKMEIGDIEQLTVVISPADADDKTVTWRSADAEVASVNSDGVVIARKAGETTITATASNGLTVECQVEVTDPNGIYSPNADDVKVMTQKDKIIVEGLPAGWYYSVHDMSGRTVYIGSDTEVPVTGGNVYVVQIKDSTRKLLVP